MIQHRFSFPDKPIPSTVLLPHANLLGAEAARLYTYMHIEESQNVNAKIWAGDHDGSGAGWPDRFVAEFPIGVVFVALEHPC